MTINASAMPDSPAVLLSDRLTKELKAATRDIPGIANQHVGVVALHTGRHVVVRTSFNGWSPVLHEARVVHERQYELTGTDGVAIDLADFLPPSHVLETLAGTQAARAADAKRLGHRHWLPKREIGHISIDHALPAILTHGHATTRMAVHEAVARAHASVHNYEGGTTLDAGGVILGERMDEDGTWLRIALPNLKIAGPSKRVATLRGFELDIDCDHLPDTVLAALPGRTVGDVARLHPEIDGRTITKARNRTNKARPGVLLTIAIDVDLLDVTLSRAAGIAGRADA
jgi:hypothetical protein